VDEGDYFFWLNLSSGLGVKKILLVQTSFLGDVVLSTPVIDGISQLYPEAEIWIMTTVQSKALVERNPKLSGCITFDKRGAEAGLIGILKKAKELRDSKFDLAYSLHRSARTAIMLYLSGIPERVGFKEATASFLYTRTVAREKDAHDVIRNMSLLGLDNFPEQDFELNINRCSEEVAKGIQERENITPPYAVLAPGSVWETKRWHWSQYKKLGSDLITSNGLKIVVIGSSNEEDVCTAVCQNTPFVNLAGKLSISELIAVVQSANLVVCNDSMPLHLASAFKIPTVSVFCATSPAFGFGPWRNKAEVVEKESLSCKPCTRHGGHSCPTGTELCMKGVEADRVLSAVNRVLAT